MLKRASKAVQRANSSVRARPESRLMARICALSASALEGSTMNGPSPSAKATADHVVFNMGWGNFETLSSASIPSWPVKQFGASALYNAPRP